MKKIIALVGSFQKGASYEAACEFGRNLKSHADVDFKIVFLKDHPLELCRGCKSCFSKGEGHCPLRDDRDTLIRMLEEADGVVLATPNYSFQVPAQVKNLFDRLAFIFHRPRFFGKAFIPIVAQGIYGGRSIVKYLSGVGQNFGFNVVKGCVLKTLEPMTDKARLRNSRQIQKASSRFYKTLSNPTPAKPSLFRLMMFRMSRASMNAMLNEDSYDFRHYREKGWFESDYYYDAKLGPVKKTMGRLFDYIGHKMAKA